MECVLTQKTRLRCPCDGITINLCCATVNFTHADQCDLVTVRIEVICCRIKLHSLTGGRLDKIVGDNR